NNNAAAASGTTLNQNAIATGSANDGSSGAEAGQALSLTDNANFINFCSGKTLTNGLQQKQGSCNGVVMGDMPATTKMVSSIITSPVPGNEPAANEDFNVTVQMTNMELGTFTNPASTYYSAPQQLSSSGTVIGHTHVTIQDIGNSQTPSQPPDASQFVFFKGINDAGNGNGLVSAVVTGGLPAGNYRVCTMAGSSNHQPVLMPVAQRGAQDDCVRIQIGGGNSQSSGNSNNGNTGNTGGSSSSATNNAASSGSSSQSSQTQSGQSDNNSGSQSTSSSAIGGIEAPAVTNSGDSTRPFEVNGNTFVNQGAAVQRACAIQNNACADAVNSGKVAGATVGDCNAQETTCNAQGGA
ncbi:hypothetical protein M406DRAFT_42153, partial [Cryphonectria parasitica EP155]